MNEQNPFERPDMPQIVSHPRYYQDEMIPGIVLQNYTKRESIEDNHYVLITHHTERLERIKQPEEIAAEKRVERIGLAIVGTIVAGFVGILGYAAYKDAQRLERETYVGTYVPRDEKELKKGS